jgi:hypothetical protein
VSYFPLFWGSRDLHGPWYSIHVWEAWPKNCHFCILGPFSWAIAHCFGFLRWFTRPKTLTTCLRGMSQNSSFLHLWPFSWAIAHSFGVLGRFTRLMTLSTCLRGMTKTHCFGISSSFMSYCP